MESYAYDMPYIPLVTFYSQRSGLMLAKPPLLDLVNMNISHWQSQSDQTAVLTVARFPMLASSGMMDEDEVVVGPNQWLATRDPAGRVYYVEHSGKAIASGRADLLDLEEKMAKYGAELMRVRWVHCMKLVGTGTSHARRTCVSCSVTMYWTGRSIWPRTANCCVTRMPFRACRAWT